MTKFTFNVNDLKPKLAMVASIIAAKNSLPILNNILFKIAPDSGRILLTAADIENRVVYNTHVVAGFTSEEEKKETEFCIDAKFIMQSFSNIEGHVTFILDNGLLTCEHGCGYFKMPYESTKEYPRHDGVGEEAANFCIKIECLQEAITRTLFAVEEDNIRPVLSTVHLDFTQASDTNKGILVSCGTNGVVLVRNQEEVETGSMDLSTPIGCNLTKKAATMLAKHLTQLDADATDVNIRLDDKHIEVVAQDYIFSARLYDGKYPNYNSVIPNTTNQSCVVYASKKELLNAMQCILPMVGTTSGMATFRVDNKKITITSNDEVFSRKGSATIDCEEEDNSSSITIGFKGVLLTESIKAVDADIIRIGFHENHRAATFSPKQQEEHKEYVSILMPMAAC